ncbi:MAG TPA: hypothetical protein VHM26_06155 [Chitinophagaceae bacterium]|jgi:hypothetical protein|nr:hypothetical protein [Chitinophagaceae bacterium]
MRLSHPDYITLVVEAYKKKQSENNLSPLLANLTRANIRQECLNVYNERIGQAEKEETDTLRAFFGVPQAGKDFSDLIEDFDLDKLRPLENLMRKKIKNPAMPNVELLAWLIDFKPRPYFYGMEIILSTDQSAIINDGIKDDAYSNEEEKGEDKNENPGDDNENSELPGKGKFRFRLKALNNKLSKAAAILLIGTISFGGIYFIGQQQGIKQKKFGNANAASCMYWAGDHYEEIACNDKRTDRFKLPLDAEKMKNFKKINREDTITARSIGKVHYIKIYSGIEFYTTGGTHPIENTKNLHPLSPYMFDKYLSKQEIAKGNQ